LKDKAYRRKIITAASVAIEDCGKDAEPLEIASCLGAVAVEIADLKPTTDKDAIIANSLTLFDNARHGIVSGVPLPWEDFSRAVGGIQRRCVCPLLGRDGAGKSFLVSKILSYLGAQRIPALSMPFEDGADRQMRRMAGCVGQYSTSEIERGYYADAYGVYHRMDEFIFQKRRKLAEESLQAVSEMPVYFEDTSMTVEQIRVVAAKYKRKHRIHIMFLDGVKDIIPSKGENATKQEEHISRVLVQTAKELDIAIIPVCHLTDLEEKVLIQRRNMRGAKSQFHNARQVLIYQNAGLSSDKHCIDENTVCLHMEKNNYGRESMVYLRKCFDKCDFEEMK
jgi:replicative DNA helicase